MRGTPAVVALALALAALLAPVALAAPGVVGAGGTSAQDGDGAVAPGERVAGAIGAQQTELDGEVEERAFGVRVAGAESDRDRADVVAERVDEVTVRLDELDDRLANLSERRERGELTRGEYAASVARVEAERRSLARQLNRSSAAAADLPADVRSERGADPERVQTLRERASELGGQEVREVARSIAGPNVGGGVGPPEHVPDHAGAGNGTGPGPPTHAGDPGDGSGTTDGEDGDAGDGQDGSGSDGADADDPDDPSDSADSEDADDHDDPADG